MTFAFKPASRESAKFLIGICGPSGSGKTLSALRLASGLAASGRIAFIDTEQGRACQYAPAPGEAPQAPQTFAFDHAVLPPPFSPERYREIIDAAVSLHPSVIIIDSLSHEWEGPGGILETVEASKARGNEFAAWAAPKQAHQKLVNLLLQTPAHVVVCMRAKEKRGLVPDPKRPGKNEVVNLGWHPICESGLTYELTINVLLNTDKKGSPVINGFDFGKLPINMLHLLQEGKQITEDTGRLFSEWAAPKQSNGIISLAETKASGGILSFQTWAQSLPDDDKATIRGEWGRLKEIAIQADLSSSSNPNSNIGHAP